MGNRASCFFTVGGRISAVQFAKLARIIAFYDLRTDWEGEPFEPEGWSNLAPLHLYANKINNGGVPRLEDFCFTNRLPFRRISGGNLGAFPPELVVCHGDGVRRRFSADDEGRLIFTADEVAAAGCLDELHFSLRFAMRDIPVLAVTDGPAGEAAPC